MRNNDKATDLRIKKMVKDNYQTVPKDEWFVRKAINRLPPKNNRILSIPEIIAFLIVFSSATIVVAVEMHRYLSPSENSSAFNLTMLTTSLFIMIASTIYMAASILYRCR